MDFREKLHDESPFHNFQLTQMARNIARRIQQRIGEVEKKASDLDSFSREVSLRVGSVGSKMANLKHHKVVKQVEYFW